VYELYAELPNASRETCAAFGSAVDAALREINIEYDAKRNTQRLHPMEVIPLGENAFARYRALRLDEGAHEGQLKWLHLSSLPATKERMRRLSEPPAGA
jgi:hypothetical protein